MPRATSTGRWGKKPRRPLYAAGMGDFRPGIDRVVRIDDGVHRIEHVVRDPEGLYADQPVYEPPVDEAMRQRLCRLSPEQAAVMWQAIRTSPHLSPEGRRERLDALLSTGLITLTFSID